jgi:heparan-alpha-glucosaminide N-acetyltransferase
MTAELLNLCVMEELRPSLAWRLVCYHQSHVEWAGGSLHDLIQPSFSFLVGVALPFSLFRRLQDPAGREGLVAHAFLRAAALVLLGVVLRLGTEPLDGISFEDTLAQIGLGYVFLFFLALRPRKVQWAAFAGILVVHWAAFALYPLPGPGFDASAVGVPPGWPHDFTGLAAHWNKNSNLGWGIDVWLLNLFPRLHPFVYSDGGYTTINFVPTLATMILGLLAGERLRSHAGTRRLVVRLALAGVLFLAAGVGLHAAGVSPIVKRLWTPSFVLVSGGFCLLFLAGFHELVDRQGYRRWALPLVVLGSNALAAYVLYQLGWALIAPLTEGTARLTGWRSPYAPVVLGTTLLAFVWAVLAVLYRKRWFIRL